VINVARIFAMIHTGRMWIRVVDDRMIVVVRMIAVTDENAAGGSEHAGGGDQKQYGFHNSIGSRQSVEVTA
jgi:hypothetical protein